jgi:hypothetical protein
MELVATRARVLVRGEVALAALLGALSAAAVVTLAPPGGDSAAHLYRALLVNEGVHLWDNLWFGGHYPLASYSSLYYFLAGPLGNVPLVAAGVVLASALFASLALDEWGDAARWPARAFAVLVAGPLYTGTYSYALGLAAVLASLKLLQLGRPWLAVACGALALGFSPLAFVFLCLALGAVLFARRTRFRRAVPVAAALGALAALQLGIVLLFPSEGRYPFSPLSLAAVLAVCSLGIALSLQSEQTRALGAFFLLWGLISVAGFVFASPFGDNLTRLRALVFPLVLLAAVLVRFRPRWLAFGAVAFALFYNLAPDVSALPKRAADASTAQERFWAPALRFLTAHSTPDYRVEVVPTFGHWEAWWVPRAGFPLARGWYRQIDLAENPELYRDPLSPAEYRSWLRRMSVRYVLVPAARLGPMGASREAKLLRSGRAGLVPVFESRDWEIFELPGAVPILTGAGAAGLTRLGHDSVAGWTKTAGLYRMRIRYTPYWHVETGRLCLERASDGMTLLRVSRPGRFELRSAVRALAAGCRQ